MAVGERDEKGLCLESASVPGIYIPIPKDVQDQIALEDITETLDATVLSFAEELAELVGFQIDSAEAKIIEDFVTISLLNCMLFAVKHKGYGFGNIARTGTKGVMLRKGDKIARLENLIGKPESLRSESKLDTLSDDSNYDIIAELVQLGLWKGAKKEDNI